MNPFQKVFLFVILCVYNLGYSQKYPISSFTIEDGIPQQQVLAIEEDSRGYIWIGTNGGGAAYYDGFEWVTISQEEGLESMLVYDVKSMDDKVFLGTDKGLYVYKNDSCSKITVKDSLSPTIFKIQLIENEILCGTDKGMMKWKENELVPFPFNHAIDSLPVLTFFKKENQWGISSLGNGCFVFREDKVEQFNKKNGISNYVFDMEMGGETLHLATYHGYFKVNQGNVENLPLFGEARRKIFDLRIKEGISYFATSQGMIILGNGDSLMLNQNHGLSHDLVWKSFEDSQGRIWTISKTDGLSCIHHLWIKKFELESNIPTKINSKTKWRDSLWFATNNGLYVLDNGKLRRRYEEALHNSGELLSIKSIHGDLYIGLFNNGLFKLTPEGKVKLYKSDDKNLQRVLDIEKLGDSNVLMLSMTGLTILEDEKISPLVHLWENKIGNDILLLGKEVLIGYEEGAVKFNLETKVVTSLLEGVTVYKIYKKEGQLHLMSENGVYSEKNGVFVKVEDSPNQAVYEGIHLKDGNWYGLSNGIFYSNDGIQKTFKNASGLGDFVSVKSNMDWNQKEIGVLGNNAYYLIDSRLAEYSTPLPILKIKSISAEGLFLNPLSNEEEIPHEKNNIVFEFDYSNYNLGATMSVFYQINKGEWIELRNSKKVYLNNLEPGKYEVVFKVCNEEEQCESSFQYSFRINVPFWKSWWFISICIAIIGLGIYSYLSIRKANDEILQKNKIIEENNKDILSSITYAKRIQSAILPDRETIQNALPNSFVFYQPKDIVSGDFYWLRDKGDEVMWSVVDCTGHGVPGAFVSMIGYNGLNRSVNEFKFFQPNENLDKLNELVINGFKISGSDQLKDGMDLALCKLNKVTGVLNYSGANNPLYIIRKGEERLVVNSEIIDSNLSIDDVFLFQIKADKQPIGYYEGQKAFTNNVIQLQEGDSIYIFTDGYADQFGGPKGKKFKYKSLKKLLLSVQSSSMEEQKEALELAYINWKGNEEQVDDICLWGFKYISGDLKG